VAQPHVGVLGAAWTQQWDISMGPTPRAPHYWEQGNLLGVSSYRVGGLTLPSWYEQVENLHNWRGLPGTRGWGAGEL